MRLLRLEGTNSPGQVSLPPLGLFHLKDMQNEKLEGVVCKNQRKKHKQRETRDKSVAGTIEK